MDFPLPVPALYFVPPQTLRARCACWLPTIIAPFVGYLGWQVFIAL
jgi:hypothetical protein